MLPFKQTHTDTDTHTEKRIKRAYDSHRNPLPSPPLVFCYMPFMVSVAEIVSLLDDRQTLRHRVCHKGQANLWGNTLEPLTALLVAWQQATGNRLR